MHNFDLAESIAQRKGSANVFASNPLQPAPLNEEPFEDGDLVTRTHDAAFFNAQNQSFRNQSFHHHRARSQSDKSGRHSVASRGGFSPASDGARSQKSRHSQTSKKSGMTQNPLHYEQKVLQHIAPGIDDRESRIYKEYDSKGRLNQSFYQRAALAGVKNLETRSFRKDSPVKQTMDRFPEKYSPPKQ